MATPGVVVVGAGIVGRRDAYELARRGVAVTLLDRGEVSAGRPAWARATSCAPTRTPAPSSS